MTPHNEAKKEDIAKIVLMKLVVDYPHQEKKGDENKTLISNQSKVVR